MKSKLHAISLTVLSLLMVVSIAVVGTFAWFQKMEDLGGVHITTGKLDISCASYMYTPAGEGTESSLNKIYPRPANDQNSNTREDIEGSEALNSSVSLTGDLTFAEIQNNETVTVYFVIKKNEGSINFNYTITAFLEGLEPTYEFASGKFEGVTSGVYDYVYDNVGGLWYDLRRFDPLGAAETLPLAEGDEATPAVSAEADSMASAETALKTWLDAGNRESAPSDDKTLIEIGSHVTSDEFSDVNDCHYYALTVGFYEGAKNLESYANQHIGIRARVMASQNQEYSNTVYSVANARALRDVLTKYLPGDTIMLLGNIEDFSGDLIFSSPVNLDLNGFTLQVTGNVRFEYNLGYDTKINTTGGGRLIVRSTGSAGANSGGDFSISTPASKVTLVGANNSGAGEGDIYVQGTFSVMSSYEKGIIFSGVNIYETNPEGGVPSTNTYKRISVNDATFVQVEHNTKVGEIHVSSRNVEQFRLLNNGEVSFVHTSNMYNVAGALSAPQIYIYNNGVIQGDNQGRHIELPAWATPWKAVVDQETGKVTGYTGNTRIVQAFNSNALRTYGSNVSPFPIEILSPEDLVEVIEGDYTRLTVNYMDPQSGDVSNTLQLILDDFFTENAEHYRLNSATVAPDDPSEVYPLIKKLVVRTANGKFITDADWAYLRGMTGLKSLDLSNSRATTVQVEVKTGPETVMQGEYAIVPAGALQGLSNLTELSLPGNTQIIRADLMGDTKNEAFRMITLPDSVLGIEMNDNGTNALHQFLAVKMPTLSHLVEVYTAGGNNDSFRDYAQRFVVPDETVAKYREKYAGEYEHFRFVPDSVLDDSGIYLVKEAANSQYTVTAVVAPIDYAISSFRVSGIRIGGASLNVTAIYDYAFYRRSNVTTVDLEGIKELGVSAFERASVTYFENLGYLTTIGNAAFRNTKIYQSLVFTNVQSVGEEAFLYDISNLNNAIPGIALPSVVTIGAKAFYNVKISTDGTQLDGSFALGTAMQSIGENAFYRFQCSDFTWTEGGALDVTLGANSFAYANLTGTVVLPANVKNVNDYAFQYAKIGNLTFNGSLDVIGEYSFQNVEIGNLLFKGAVDSIGNYAIQKVEIGAFSIDGVVETVGEYAFQQSTFTSVTFGAAVNSIEQRAFYSVNTDALTFEGNVGSIGYAAFMAKNASNLGALTFNDGINYIYGEVSDGFSFGGFNTVVGTSLVINGDLVGAQSYSIKTLTFSEKIEINGNVEVLNGCFTNVTTPIFEINGSITAGNNSFVTVKGSNSPLTFTVNGDIITGSSCFQTISNATSVTVTGNLTLGNGSFAGITATALTVNGNIVGVTPADDRFFYTLTLDTLLINGDVLSGERGTFNTVHVKVSAIFKGKVTVDYDTFQYTVGPLFSFEKDVSFGDLWNFRLADIGRVEFLGHLTELGYAFGSATIGDLYINSVGSMTDDRAFGIDNGGMAVITNITIKKVGSLGAGLKNLNVTTWEFDEVTTIEKNLLYRAYDRITIKSKVETVKNGAFTKVNGGSVEVMEFLGGIGTVEANGFASADLGELKVVGDISSLGTSAFSGATVGTFAVYGDMSTVGINAFQNANVTQTFAVEGNVSTLGANAFDGLIATDVELYFGGDLGGTSIGGAVFTGMQAKKLTVLGSMGLASGKETFYNSTVLGGMYFHGTVNNIVEGAFKEAKTKEIVFYSQIINGIGASAFEAANFTPEAEGDTGYRVEFCGAVRGKIGNNAFKNAVVNEIVFHQMVENIGDYAFADIVSDGVTVKLCGNVNSLGVGVFQNTKADLILIGVSDGSVIPTAPTVTSPLPALPEAETPVTPPAEEGDTPAVLNEGENSGESGSEAEGETDVEQTPSTFYPQYTAKGRIASIGANAFAGSQINNIYISTTTDLGTGAFLGCKITGELVFLGDVDAVANYAFSGADVTAESETKTVINRLHFTGATESIGKNAFAFAEITTAVFEKDTASIGAEVFTNATIGSLTFNGNITAIDERAFKNATFGRVEYGENVGTVTFAGTIGSVGTGAFEGAVFQTTSVTFVGSIETVEEAAFKLATFKSPVAFKANVAAIGASAFETVTFGGNVSFLGKIETVGENAFSNATFAASLTFGDSEEDAIGTVGVNAFHGASVTGNVTFNASVGEIQGEAFRRASVSEMLFNGAVSTLSDTSQTSYSGDIADKSLAFEGAKIKKLYFKYGVGYIGHWAFARAELHDLVFGDASLAITDLAETTMGNRAFTATKVTVDTLKQYTGSIAFNGHVYRAYFDSVNDGFSSYNTTFTVAGTLYFKFVDTFNLTTHSNNLMSNTNSIGVLRFDSVNTVSAGIGRALSIKEIYLPASLQSIKLAGISGVQVFDWEESTDPTASVTLLTSGTNGAFQGFKFLGEELVFPSQVKTVPENTFSAVSTPAITFKGATTVGHWCFSSSSIGVINLPKVTSINREVFHRAVGTHTINLPELTEIKGYDNFVACLALTTLNVPKLSKISSKGAFVGASSLTTLDLPGVTALDVEGVFGNLYDADGNIAIYEFGSIVCEKYTYVETLNMTNLTTISAKAFTGNTVIQTLNLPSLTDIEVAEAFAGMNATALSLPALKTLDVAGAFQNMTKLVTLDLPALETIAEGCYRAFSGCSSLQALNLKSLKNINDGSTFSGLSSITKVIADENYAVEEGEYALNLYSLESMVTSNAFKDCGKLKSIELNVTELTGSAWANNMDRANVLAEVSLPKLTSLKTSSLFAGCKNLTTVSMPLLTEISGSSNFTPATNGGAAGVPVTSLNFPALTVISGSGNFMNCKSLSTFTANKLTILSGGSNFQGCSVLNDVNMDNLISIGDAGNSGSGSNFKGCTALAELNFPSLTTVCGTQNFNGTGVVYLGVQPDGSDHLPSLQTVMHDGNFTSCSLLKSIHLTALSKVSNAAHFGSNAALTSVTLPSLTNLGSRTFEFCTALEEFESDVVTAMGSQVFQGCTSLKTVSLPNCRIFDGNGATCHFHFKDCKNLVNVNLPLVTQIGRGSFQNCTSLRALSLPSLTSFASDDNSGDIHAFDGCTSLVYLDLGMIPLKAETNWSSIGDFGNAIPNLRVLKIDRSDRYCDVDMFSGFTGNFAIIISEDTISGDITGDIWNENDANIANGTYGVAFGPSTNQMISANLTGGKRAPFSAGVSAENIKFYPAGSELYNGTSDIAYMYADICDDLGNPTGRLSLMYCFKSVITTEQLYADIAAIENETGKRVTEIGASAYLNTVVTGDVLKLGDSVTKIGAHAFSKPLYMMTKTEGVQYGEAPDETHAWSRFKTFETGNVTEIGDYAFRYAIIDDLSFGVELLSVGKTAFYNGVTNVRIDQQIEGAFATALHSDDLAAGSVMFVRPGGGTANLYVNSLVLGKAQGDGSYKEGTLRHNGNYFGAIDLFGTGINTDRLHITADFDFYYEVTEGNNVKITSIISKNAGATALEIPSTIVSGDEAFTVTQIGEYAFIGLKGLNITSVTLPKELAAFSLTDASGLIFNKEYFLETLTEFKVADGCVNYSVEGGVLYNADQTELILCPMQKRPESGNTYYMPVSVRKIYAFAFYGNEYILNVEYVS